MLKLFNAAMMLSLASVCAATPSNLIFSNPEGLSGETVSVTGYLIFKSENKNLYPSRDSHQDWMKKRCLPIGVLNTDDSMSVKLSQLSGKRVVVRGKVQRLVADGELNDSLCKDWGLLIDDVRPH